MSRKIRVTQIELLFWICNQGDNPLCCLNTLITAGKGKGGQWDERARSVTNTNVYAGPGAMPTFNSIPVGNPAACLLASLDDVIHLFPAWHTF